MTRKVTTRCVSDNRQYTDNIVNSNRKTTRSWPVICRKKTNQYTLADEANSITTAGIGANVTATAVVNTTDDDDEDDDDDENDDDENEFFVDDDDDYETVFAANVKDSLPSVETTSCRKYLVVDYNNPSNQVSNEFGTKGKAPRKSIVARMATSAQPRASIGRDGRPVLANASSTTCTTPPPIIFLLVTLLLTAAATAMMSVAVMTDHWETITWDRDFLIKLTNNTPHVLHWHLNERVARMPISRHGKRENIFLVPMHGGIWTLCIDLNEHEMRQLGRFGFPYTTKCVNYLDEGVEYSRHDDMKYDSPHVEYPVSRRPSLRMQNLSISCSLVCLIILGSAALLGAFGVFQRQISAILVTGVMYLLAALFALFTLMIIHFKRHNGRSDADFDGTVEGFISKKGDGRVAQHLLNARIFNTSWSLDLGWGGVVLCGITYVLWIMLSKIMRYNPISALLI